MESTGRWSEELAADLHEHGHVVSIVNPPAIKSFGQSELSRTKTDKADAALIVRFCITMHPALWEPPSPLQQRLRRLGRRRVALDETRVQESNRLGAPGSSDVRPFPDDDLTLRGKLELLMWIPGIGERLAVTILGELPHISEFRSAKGTLALHGTVPARPIGEIGIGIVAVKDRQPSSSADAVRAGCRSNSLQPNPQGFAKRLRSSGKHGKQIVAPVMRRLLVLAFGVLKSERPFDPEIGCGRRHGHHPISPSLSP